MDGLQREIGKRKPFDLPEEEAYLNLLRTQSALASQCERLFRREGLSGSGYNILRILRGAAPAPRCPREIADQLVAAVPDMTRLLDRLEDQGLVSRERSVEDRRMVLVRLTAKGQKVLASLDEPLRELHRAQLGHLSREDLRELSRLLVLARRGG